MQKTRAVVVVIAPEERLDERFAEVTQGLGEADEALAVAEGKPIRKQEIEDASASAEVFVFVSPEAVLAPGWLDGLVESFRPERVNLQGDGSPEPASCPSGDYGAIGIVGPVSEATRSGPPSSATTKPNAPPSAPSRRLSTS